MEGCNYCCQAELFNAFDLLDEEYIPGAVQVSDLEEELVKCPKCNRLLEDDNYIVEDEEELLTESLEYLASKINQRIYECQYCNWTIIPYEQQNGDPINLNSVGELVDNYFIPTELKPRLSRELRCRCGNPVALDDPYVSEKEVSDWFNDEVEYIIVTFGISADETQEFILFLQQNPMLGLAHPVGQKIFSKVEAGDLPGIEELSVGSIYYRGRTRNKYQRLVPFIDEELWNPPIGIPQQGRFNPPGVTNLYLGSLEEAVLLEISPSSNDIVDIAEFEIQRKLKVFNSTRADIDIFASMVKENNGYTNSYEYIFPNFLSQCLAYHGFNGIIYTSVKDEKALNLCLFNFIKDEDIRITKLHVNANLTDYADPFGINPKRNTILIETKEDDLTKFF
ncbi:hypothetical protein A499_18424 [Niallia nealsonii AAU1]|nr:hypothetical protein A499_18424 [Niallia nealsonii AAU1]